MLTGSIQFNRPLIEIAIGHGQNVQRVPALVDTGFTGELKMPPEIARGLEVTIEEVRTVTMGNAVAVPHGVGRTQVSLDGLQKEVRVLVGDGPTVIGISLMRNFGFKLTVIPSENVFYLERGDADPFLVEE